MTYIVGGSKYSIILYSVLYLDSCINKFYAHKRGNRNTNKQYRIINIYLGYREIFCFTMYQCQIIQGYIKSDGLHFSKCHKICGHSNTSFLYLAIIQKSRYREIITLHFSIKFILAPGVFLKVSFCMKIPCFTEQ